MLTNYHRGAYEYLWSEHKYAQMAFSLKSYLALSSKLGKNPQLTVAFQKLAKGSVHPWPELYNATLHAYDHIKDSLTRPERFETINLLLNDNAAALEKIFKHILDKSVQALYGCRLFYPPGHSINKYWNTLHKYIFVVCFGPFQNEMLPSQVFWRICKKTKTSQEHFKELLRKLKVGLSIERFNNIEEGLKLELFNNNLVAVTKNYCYLHPGLTQIDFDQFTDLYDVSIEEQAAFALELYWDSYTDLSEIIFRSPQADNWETYFRNFTEQYGFCFDSDSCLKAFSFLKNAFTMHKARETSGKQIDINNPCYA